MKLQQHRRCKYRETDTTRESSIRCVPNSIPPPMTTGKVSPVVLLIVPCMHGCQFVYVCGCQGTHNAQMGTHNSSLTHKDYQGTHNGFDRLGTTNSFDAVNEHQHDKGTQKLTHSRSRIPKPQVILMETELSRTEVPILCWIAPLAGWHIAVGHYSAGCWRQIRDRN